MILMLISKKFSAIANLCEKFKILNFYIFSPFAHDFFECLFWNHFNFAAFASNLYRNVLQHYTIFYSTLLQHRTAFSCNLLEISPATPVQPLIALSCSY